MKRLFGKKKNRVLEVPQEQKDVDRRPGVYSDAMVWTVSQVRKMPIQPTPA